MTRRLQDSTMTVRATVVLLAACEYSELNLQSALTIAAERLELLIPYVSLHKRSPSVLRHRWTWPVLCSYTQARLIMCLDKNHSSSSYSLCTQHCPRSFIRSCLSAPATTLMPRQQLSICQQWSMRSNCLIIISSISEGETRSKITKSFHRL